MSQEPTPNGPEHEGANAEAKAPPAKAAPPSEPPTNIYVPPVALPKSNVPAAQPDAKVVLNLPLEPVEHISEDQIRQARQRRRTATVKVDRAAIDAKTKVADLGVATKSAPEIAPVDPQSIADPETDSIEVDVEATPAIAKSYVAGAAAARAAADLAAVDATTPPRGAPPPPRAVRAEAPTPRAVPSPRIDARVGKPASIDPSKAPSIDPRAAQRASIPVETSVAKPSSIPPPRPGSRAWMVVVAVAVLGGGALLAVRSMGDDAEAERPTSTRATGQAAATSAATTTTQAAATAATTAATAAPSTTASAAVEAPAAVATNATPPAHFPAGAAPRPPSTFPKATAPPRPPTAPGKLPKPKGDIPSEI